jgi:hypothetical protein
METERFAVPEVLFNPIDIGLDEAGVAEATWQSLRSLRNTVSDKCQFLSLLNCF